MRFLSETKISAEGILGQDEFSIHEYTKVGGCSTENCASCPKNMSVSNFPHKQEHHLGYQETDIILEFLDYTVTASFMAIQSCIPFLRQI